MAGETTPEDLMCAETHEWVRVEGKTGTVGITDNAQSELGDVVFLELPEVGATFEKGQAFAVIESVKAVSDCNLPVSGTIVEVNSSLEESPQEVNSDPYGKGWMVKIQIEDLSQLDSLMDATAYSRMLEEKE